LTVRKRRDIFSGFAASNRMTHAHGSGPGFAHVTLPTRDVDGTAAFLERTLGYTRAARPHNSPVDTVWLDIGRGQQIHVIFIEKFEVSPFEAEFGRHVAIFSPRQGFAALKQRLIEHGATLIEPLRATPFERFFFREPVNGYVFEVIEPPSNAS
jgi:catechol 2,3-dioxygenase-like lactoylglutathione lyase family enzyme